MSVPRAQWSEKKQVGCRQCKFSFFVSRWCFLFHVTNANVGCKFSAAQWGVSFVAMWASDGEYFCEIVQGGVKKCRHVHQIIMTHYYNHIYGSPGAAYKLSTLSMLSKSRRSNLDGVGKETLFKISDIVSYSESSF
jgi:hypothetical protein